MLIVSLFMDLFRKSSTDSTQLSQVDVSKLRELLRGIDRGLYGVDGAKLGVIRRILISSKTGRPKAVEIQLSDGRLCVVDASKVLVKDGKLVYVDKSGEGRVSEVDDLIERICEIEKAIDEDRREDAVVRLRELMKVIDEKISEYSSRLRDRAVKYDTTKARIFLTSDVKELRKLREVVKSCRCELEDLMLNVLILERLKCRCEELLTRVNSS